MEVIIDGVKYVPENQSKMYSIEDVWKQIYAYELNHVIEYLRNASEKYPLIENMSVDKLKELEPYWAQEWDHIHQQWDYIHKMQDEGKA